MVDDGTVFKHADDHLWVATNGLDHEAYFADATKGLDVTVEYIAPELPHLQVQGPRSREALQPLTDADLGSLRYFHFIPEEVRVGGVPVWLSRTGFSGELGYELFTRPEHAEDLWSVIEGTGAVPYGVDVVEPIRIEAGMIVTDYDYEAHQRTPYDLGLDRVVALDANGDFMGKEALRAVAAAPPNRFKTLRLDGEELPEYGATVSRGGRGGRGVDLPGDESHTRTDRPRDPPRRRGRGGDQGRCRARRGHDRRDRRRPRRARPREAAPPKLIAEGRTQEPKGRSRRLAPMTAIVGVVPNFSEGRRRDVIDAIVDALDVEGARVVFAEADPDHHRLDTTVLGDADAVRRSADRGDRRGAWSGSTCSSTAAAILGWAPRT